MSNDCAIEVTKSDQNRKKNKTNMSSAINLSSDISEKKRIDSNSNDNCVDEAQDKKISDGNDGNDEADSDEDSWFCNFTPFRHSSPEATAWALDASTRGPLIMANIFIGKTLLGLAKIAADCDPLSEDPCSSKVYGFKPSSLLTIMITISGVINGCLMPIIGAIVDHTSWRHGVGLGSAVLLIFVNGAIAFISEANWFTMVILQIFGGFAYLTHAVVSFAYFSEISSDRYRIARLAASYNIKQYASSVLLLASVTSICYLWDLSDVATVRISQGIVVATVMMLMIPAWIRLFKPRAALRTVPENQWLISTGFRKLAKTGYEIVVNHRALKLICCSLLCSEAAGNSFAQVAITFTDQTLRMDTTETGILMLIIFLSSIPGSKFATYITNTFNPLWSYMSGLFMFGSTTVLASIFVKDEADKIKFFLLSLSWGFAFGWIFPAQRTLWVMIIPKQQETEMMGIYICCGQVLLWLPPMIFTILNESGVDIRYGLFSQSVFYYLAILFLLSVGSFENALKETHGDSITDGGEDDI